MRVLLADRDTETRSSLRRLFAATFRDVTCAEAGTAEQAADLALRMRWDVIVLDISLREAAEMTPLTRIHDVAPSVPVVVLTDTEEEKEAEHVFRAGASAYLAKASPPEVLMDAVRAVLSGRRFIGDAIRRVTAK